MNIANAPCSWGVLEFGLDGPTDDFDTVLDEMQQTGYTGTELGDWGFMPTSPDALRNELEQRSLHLVGAFVPVNFIDKSAHSQGVSDALKIARLMSSVDPGNACIVLSDDNGRNKIRTQFSGRIQPHQGLLPSEWKTFANGVESIASTVFDETGIKSVFHHHCAGYVETPDEIEMLMQLTDQDLVGLCFDTGHYAYGGGDPVEGLKKFSDRIDHVHFKDWDASVFEKAVKNDWDYFQSVGNGIFCELGEGSVDFRSVVDELDAQSYNGWIVVEQDILPGMGSPKESARRNRDYLISLGL